MAQLRKFNDYVYVSDSSLDINENEIPMFRTTVRKCKKLTLRITEIAMTYIFKFDASEGKLKYCYKVLKKNIKFAEMYPSVYSILSVLNKLKTKMTNAIIIDACCKLFGPPINRARPLLSGLSGLLNPPDTAFDVSYKNNIVYYLDLALVEFKNFIVRYRNTTVKLIQVCPRCRLRMHYNVCCRCTTDLEFIKDSSNLFYDFIPQSEFSYKSFRGFIYLFINNTMCLQFNSTKAIYPDYLNIAFYHRINKY